MSDPNYQLTPRQLLDLAELSPLIEELMVTTRLGILNWESSGGNDFKDFILKLNGDFPEHRIWINVQTAVRYGKGVAQIEGHRFIYRVNDEPGTNRCSVVVDLSMSLTDPAGEQIRELYRLLTEIEKTRPSAIEAAKDKAIRQSARRVSKILQAYRWMASCPLDMTPEEALRLCTQTKS